MSYTKVDWKDYPDTATPVSATNLSHMDDGIAENTADITTLKNSLGDQVSFTLNGSTLEITTKS